MPEVVAAYEKHQGRGFRVLAVSADDPGRSERLAEIMADHHVTFPVIYDAGGSDGPLVSRNRVTGFPTTFLIDRRGRVRYTDLSGETLECRIVELLAEPGSASEPR